jgi:hypothetical protein
MDQGTRTWRREFLNTYLEKTVVAKKARHVVNPQICDVSVMEGRDDFIGPSTVGCDPTYVGFAWDRWKSRREKNNMIVLMEQSEHLLLRLIINSMQHPSQDIASGWVNRSRMPDSRERWALGIDKLQSKRAGPYRLLGSVASGSLMCDTALCGREKRVEMVSQDFDGRWQLMRHAPQKCLTLQSVQGCGLLPVRAVRQGEGKSLLPRKRLHTSTPNPREGERSLRLGRCDEETKSRG